MSDELAMRRVISLSSLWFLDVMMAFFLWHAFRFTFWGYFLPYFYVSVALPLSFLLVRSRLG